MPLLQAATGHDLMKGSGSAPSQGLTALLGFLFGPPIAP